jgi:hypothetical protein
MAMAIIIANPLTRSLSQRALLLGPLGEAGVAASRGETDAEISQHVG